MTVLKRRDTFTLLLPAAVKRGLAVVLVGGLLAACTVTETRRGHLLPEGVAAELSAANMSQQRVVELLGTPSTRLEGHRPHWPDTEMGTPPRHAAQLS